MSESNATDSKPVSPRPLRRWTIGLNVLLQLVLLFALFAIVNYASFRHYIRRDLSPGRDYTLSEMTTNFLRKLSKDVTLTLVFTRDSDLIPDVRALLEEIRRAKHNRIRVTEVDPARDLDRAEELKLQNNITLHGNGILVRVGDRARFISEEELVIRGVEGTRENPSVDFRGEDAVLSAIIGLIEKGTRKLYFISGKGAAGGRDTAPDLAALTDIGSR
ncbi:MAG TPA: Gldg family protein, partial [Verrucomicrobiaceae bacterium]